MLLETVDDPAAAANNVQTVVLCCACLGFLEQLLNPRQLIGLMAQGFQRDLSHEGEVLPLPEPSKRLLVSKDCIGSCG